MSVKNYILNHLKLIKHWFDDKPKLFDGLLILILALMWISIPFVVIYLFVKLLYPNQDKKEIKGYREKKFYSR